MTSGGGGSFRRDLRGVTLLELLVVVVVLGTLVRIALPNVQQVRVRGEAARVIGDLQAVQVAALNYHEEHRSWPADRGPGATPPELIPYLPQGFTFRREGYLLDWENWTIPDGLPRHPRSTVLVGVSVTTERPELGRAVVELLGPGTRRYTLNHTYTFIIEGL